MLGAYLEKAPAIIVLPQCRRGAYWSDPEMEKYALQTLEETLKEMNGDGRRVYLVGVSMGGYGAWQLAANHKSKFAALVPICGGSPLRNGDRFAPIARGVGQTPVWVFHGADDRVVPVEESRRMVAALKEIGGNVRYNEYAGIGHNVWMQAMAEPELFSWLLAQRLPSSE